MGLVPVTETQVYEAQASLREMVKPPEQSLGNVDLAAGLLDSTYFTFGRFKYEVKPVPHGIGLKLEDLRLRIDKIAMKKDQTNDELLVDNEETGVLFEKATALFWQLVRPTFWPQRLLKRWLTNPFKSASPMDVTTLLHFFCLCRMRSAVRLSAKGSGHKQDRSSMIQLMT